MTYTVLARKWRPKTFAEMVGQQHVVDALTRALTMQRIHHAYLFTGTRGVGKTTVARILAKSLCCEQQITATPCGQCDSCKDIDAGCYPELIEVDAASRTRVEETRDLLDNVAYLPSRGRFKIYLIDEVHMLSTHSFNALLKTLEEPPEHVKFLFATTDPQKLPATVLSRCLQYHLKPVMPDVISSHLGKIAQAENIQFEEEAVNYIAHAAEGSLRDALSLLDQAIAYGAGIVSVETTRNMLGLVAPEHVFIMLNTIAQREGEKLIRQVSEVAQQGVSFEAILAAMLTVLQRVATLQIVPTLQLEVANQQQLQELAKIFSAETVQLLYSIVLLGRRDLTYAPDQRSAFEMIMLRMFAFMPVYGEPIEITPPTPTIIAQPKITVPAMERTLIAPSISITPPKATIVPEQKVTLSEEKKLPSSGVAAKHINGKSWLEVINSLRLVGLTSALAKHSVLTEFQPDYAELTLSPQHEALYSEVQQQRLTEALSSYLGRQIKVRVVIGITTQETPVHAAQQIQQHAKAEMIASMQNDPGVKELEKQLGAVLDIKSIQPV